MNSPESPRTGWWVNFDFYSSNCCNDLGEMVIDFQPYYFCHWTMILDLLIDNPLMLCLLAGVGVRSVDSSHSSVYLLKMGRDWESHSVGLTHFWSGEWEWDSHWGRWEWESTPTSPISTLFFILCFIINKIK